MNKITRNEYDIQEELMEAIFKLIAKRSSFLFQEPVDAQEYPDYYQVITEPMDLQTIVNKLQNLEYKFANEILQDLQLIIKNCIYYNKGNEKILKKVKRFEECVKTTWTNFLKQISRKNISVNKPFTHSRQMLERLINLYQKRKQKKYDHFENICQKTTESDLQHSSIIQPIQVQNRFQQFFQYLHGVSQNYDAVHQKDKINKCSVNIDSTSIKQAFYIKSEMKLQKYKKLLFKKLFWINQKIIGKSLRTKKFQKLQAPKILYEYFDKGKIIQSANTHKIQLYLKHTLLWIQQYQDILNGYFKDKLIDNCQNALRCLRKIIKYKKWQKHIDSDYFIYDIDKDFPSEQQSYEQNQLDQSLNKVTRQFKKMMLRDRQISYKKDTKIAIKDADGELIIIDNPGKLLPKNNRKKSELQFKYEITIFDESREKIKLQEQQKKQNKQFIEQYSHKNNLEIINKLDGKLFLDWDEIIGEKMNDVIKLDFMSVQDSESWKQNFLNEQEVLGVWQYD